MFMQGLKCFSPVQNHCPPKNKTEICQQPTEKRPFPKHVLVMVGLPEYSQIINKKSHMSG